jgi:hypothetical protein
MTFFRSDWDNARGAVHRVFIDKAAKDLPAAIRQAQRIVNSTYVKLQNSETLVASLENQLDLIGDRWQPSSPEYQEVKKEITHRQYRQALDGLKHLVVQ